MCTLLDGANLEFELFDCPIMSGWRLHIYRTAAPSYDRWRLIAYEEFDLRTSASSRYAKLESVADVLWQDYVRWVREVSLPARVPPLEQVVAARRAP